MQKQKQKILTKGSEKEKISSSTNISLLTESPLLKNFLEQKLIFNEEEREILKTFIKKIPAAIAVFDTQLNYVITSDRWVEETKSPVKDLIGKNHYEVVPDVPRKWRRANERGLQGEHLKSEEDKFKRQDGSIEWIRWEIQPWYKSEGVIGGIIMFIEHITKRKMLEKKMKEMIQALNHSNDELEKFAHICAHDLNEPLRTIGSYGKILEAELEGKLSSQAKSYLVSITENIKQMNALVNGILAYSQFESPTLNMGACFLQQVVNSVKMALENKIKEKNAFIYSGPLPVVYGDTVLLTRLFQNLISNSLKFNESDMPIIYITAQAQKDFWLFTIEDNGIGIDPKYHKIIFDLFKRLHNKSKYAGTGIGLSLCKKIVEAHGGKIWLKSTPNNGAQFSFTLPKLNTSLDKNYQK